MNRSDSSQYGENLLSGKGVQDLLFLCTCAVTGVAVCVVLGIGGYALLASALAFLLFAILAVASVRAAVLSVFAFSLFQPVITRILYQMDYPDALEQSMLGYKDPLTTTVSLLLIAAAGIAIAHHLRYRLGAINGMMTTIIAFYAVLNALQCFNPSTSLLIGVYGAKNNVAPMLMLFAGSLAIRTPKHAEHFVRFLACFSAVALSYGVFQEFVGFVGFDAYWFSRTVPENSSMYHLFVYDVEVRDPYIATSIEPRVPSVFQGYTFYSYVIAAFGIIIYAMKQSFAKGGWRILRLSIFVLLALYFAVSMERAAIVMFAVGVLAVHFAVSRERKRLFRFVFIGGFVVAILATAFNVGARTLTERGLIAGNSKLIRVVELSNPLTASTVTIGRIRHHWPEAMSVVRANPLTGTGAGTGMFTRASKEKSDLVMPHNEFLHKLVELGPIGLLCFASILFLLYRALISACTDKDSAPRQRAYAAGMIGVFAAYLVCGVMNVPYTYQPGVVFWFLAGAALGRQPGISA